MKETKVYMSKLPESCVGCKHFAENRRQCNLELCLQWSEEKFKFNDCPLIDIKTHDRELVKEVCEKIRKKVDNISMHTATKERLMLMCEEIQKEYEK